MLKMFNPKTAAFIQMNPDAVDMNRSPMAKRVSQQDLSYQSPDYEHNSNPYLERHPGMQEQPESYERI